MPPSPLSHFCYRLSPGTRSRRSRSYISARKEAVEPRLTGSAVGYNGICTHMGAIVGPPALGAIVDATASYTGGWLMTDGVVAVGVLLLSF